MRGVELRLTTPAAFESAAQRTARLREDYAAASARQVADALAFTQRAAAGQRDAAEHAPPRIAEQLRRAAAANELAIEMIRRSMS